MTLSARTSSLLTLTFASVFLVLTLFGVVVARRAYESAVAWVLHTNGVSVAIADVRADLADVQRKAASETLTEGDLVDLRARAQTVRRLTLDNPRQQSRTDSLLSTLDTLTRASHDPKGLPEAVTESARALLDAMDSEEGALMEVRLEAQSRKDTEVWLVLGTSVALTIFSVAFAIRKLREHQQSLAEQVGLLSSVLESSGDGIIALGQDRRFLVANAFIRRLFPEGAVGMPLRADWGASLEARTEDGRPIPTDGALVRSLGGASVDDVRFSVTVPNATERVWLSVTTRPVRDANNRVVAAVGVLRDVTLAHTTALLVARQNEQLRMQTLVDGLTGLYNRRGFMLLSEQYARTARRTKRQFAVLFGDLNGLKIINDGLGHDAGDRAIRAIAALLRTTARESDIIARLGGDEFVALMDGADEPAIGHFTRRLGHAIALDAMRSPEPFALSISLGAAYRAADGTESVDELIAKADQAMYAQKKDRGAQRD